MPLNGERRGRASGKVILVGEHFAVHGGAALAVPVRSRGIEVRVSAGTGLVSVAPGLAADIGPAVRAMLATLVPDSSIEPAAIDVHVAGDLPLAGRDLVRVR